MIKPSRKKLLGAALILGVPSVLLLPVTSYGHGVDLGSVSKIFETSDRRKANAKTQIQSQRADADEAPATSRRSNCLNRQEDVETEMEALYAKTTAYTYEIDAVFESLHDLYDNSELKDKEELDAPLKRAETAYLNTQIETGALSLLNSRLNCDNPDVAVTIAAFAATTRKARQALIEYRQAVLELAVAISATEEEAI